MTPSIIHYSCEIRCSIILHYQLDFTHSPPNEKTIIRAVTRIPSGKFNTSDFTSWEVDSTSDLRELLIEDDCFGYVKDLRLSLFTSLERINIGDNCFCNMEGGTFEVKNCINMKSVTIGDNSFTSVKRVTGESGCSNKLVMKSADRIVG